MPSTIAEYQAEIQRYQVLKGKVHEVAARLSGAVGGLNRAESGMRGSFVVNNRSTTLELRTTALARQVRDSASTLTGSISPAIDAAIAECRRQIAILEEEERRRAAEEAARAALAGGT